MLSDRTFGLLHQIHEAIQMLKDWNKSILCVDDYYSSPEGMKNLAASCMLIEAIGESVKLIDKMTDGNHLYFTIALPYQFGVKAGYISRQTVVQQFETAQGNIDLLKAEKILPIFSNKY